MYVPNGWTPSVLSRHMRYDVDGRSMTKSEHGVSDGNSLYRTDAERFDAVSPFLLANKRRDAQRRNYIIQPGGNAIYFWDKVPQSVEFPDDRTSFGHDSNPHDWSAGKHSRVGQ